MRHLTRDPIVFGHRGVKNLAPENSLTGIQLALDMGLDGIEIDVLDCENTPVVIHQDDLSLTTPLSGLVSESSLDAISAHVPQLEEVLALVSGQVVLNIEIKHPSRLETLLPIVQPYLDNYGVDRILFSSFDWQRLRALREAISDCKIGILSVGAPLYLDQLANELNASSLHLHVDFITDTIVSQAHHLGLAVYVFTVRSAEHLVQLSNYEFDGYFSDFGRGIL